jgi:four helix bundle protein
VQSIRFTQNFPQNGAGWTLTKQIIRSATSIGANFREAQYARSRAEFISKIHVALQEASESLYWLETIKASGIGDPKMVEVLIAEADQLLSILVAIAKTTKRNINRVN